MRNVEKIKDIVKLIGKAPADNVQLEIIDLLFTPQELAQLVDRFSIVKGLFLQKSTQRELAAELKLSIAKITRGSNGLKRISPKLRAYLGEFFHE